MSTTNSYSRLLLPLKACQPFFHAVMNPTHGTASKHAHTHRASQRGRGSANNSANNSAREHHAVGMQLAANPQLSL
jgi:hypothetical protein